MFKRCYNDIDVENATKYLYSSILGVYTGRLPGYNQPGKRLYDYKEGKAIAKSIIEYAEEQWGCAKEDIVPTQFHRFLFYVWLVAKKYELGEIEL